MPDRVVNLTERAIIVAGSAMDCVLAHPHLMKDTQPEHLAELRATRDLFWSLNQENAALNGQETI